MGARRHRSYANVVSTMALVAALSGGALAATGMTGSGGIIEGCVSKHSGDRTDRANGTAVAYAHINTDGTVGAANSMNTGAVGLEHPKL